MPDVYGTERSTKEKDRPRFYLFLSTRNPYEFHPRNMISHASEMWEHERLQTCNPKFGTRMQIPKSLTIPKGIQNVHPLFVTLIYPEKPFYIKDFICFSLQEIPMNCTLVT
uniref:Uncharacterized protein n=1 Tax=Corethron hystrix TaxID=216773 RepID=A0A7S1BK58_9STRA|mmetsp:Transcript_296/g.656  ORF Transcript_296/g.656 Transcript_296/m.656 type:complete len:111 (+) Transcript_296:425-757(+)